MKARRSTVIPLILLVYLAVMATIGWDEYAAPHFIISES